MIQKDEEERIAAKLAERDRMRERYEELFARRSWVPAEHLASVKRQLDDLEQECARLIIGTVA